jgi:hypothetical protein
MAGTSPAMTKNRVIFKRLERAWKRWILSSQARAAPFKQAAVIQPSLDPFAVT